MSRHETFQSLFALYGLKDTSQAKHTLTLPLQQQPNGGPCAMLSGHDRPSNYKIT